METRVPGGSTDELPAKGVAVSKDLQTLYDGYYPDRNTKREITAAQTIEHIRSVWQNGHINLYNGTTLTNLLETTGLQVDSLRLFGNSLAYEQCVFGDVSGSIKYTIRTGLLRAAPRLATAGMTYMAIASCTPHDALRTRVAPGDA